MKLLVCLASLLVIATAQEEEDSFIDMMGQMMENGTAELKSMLFEYIEEDGSAYKPLIQAAFEIVEPQFCPLDSAKQCVGSTSWLFGCKCRKIIAADLGECSDAPCRAFRWVKEKGPGALSSFANADSYEERMRVLVDSIVNPFSRLLCECPGVFGASIKCAKNYNGQVFEMERFDLDKTRFENVVNTVDWKAAQGIFKGYLDVGCGEHKGDDCVEQFGELWVAIGAFMDNTFTNREDTCLSLIRVEAEYEAYMKSFYGDKDDIGAYVNGIVDTYVTLEHKLMCGADCADEIQENFYNSCCNRRASKRFVAPAMRKKYGKLARSIAVMFDYTLPESLNLKAVLKKYISVQDPETFCGEEIDAYRELNEQCDAIEV